MMRIYEEGKSKDRETRLLALAANKQGLSKVELPAPWVPPSLEEYLCNIISTPFQSCFPITSS